jgi:hypothetical protein
MIGPVWRSVTASVIAGLPCFGRPQRVWVAGRFFHLHQYLADAGKPRDNKGVHRQPGLLSRIIANKERRSQCWFIAKRLW